MHFVGIHISSLIGCSDRSISPLFDAAGIEKGRSLALIEALERGFKLARSCAADQPPQPGGVAPAAALLGASGSVADRGSHQEPPAWFAAGRQERLDMPAAEQKAAHKLHHAALKK